MSIPKPRTGEIWRMPPPYRGLHPMMGMCKAQPRVNQMATVMLDPPVMVMDQVHPTVLAAISSCLGIPSREMRNKLDGMRMIPVGSVPDLMAESRRHPATAAVSNNQRILKLEQRLMKARENEDQWRNRCKDESNKRRRAESRLETGITSIPEGRCDYIIESRNSSHTSGSDGSGVTTAYFNNGADVDATSGPWALKLSTSFELTAIMYARQTRAALLKIAPPTGHMITVLKRSSVGDVLYHGYETRVAAKFDHHKMKNTEDYEAMIILIKGMFPEYSDIGGSNNGMWQGKPVVIDWGFGCSPLKRGTDHGADVNSKLKKMREKRRLSDV